MDRRLVPDDPIGGNPEGKLRRYPLVLGEDDEISVVHLSDDFLEQYREAAPLNIESNNHLPATTVQAGTVSLDHLEAQAIRQAVRECNGNISAAARRLGISRNTLYRKMRSIGQ